MVRGVDNMEIWELKFGTDMLGWFYICFRWYFDLDTNFTKIRAN